MSSKKTLTILSLILILGMLVSACAQPAPAPVATQAPAASPSRYRGPGRYRTGWSEDDLRDRPAGREPLLWRHAGDRRR